MDSFGGNYFSKNFSEIFKVYTIYVCYFFLLDRKRRYKTAKKILASFSIIASIFARARVKSFMVISLSISIYLFKELVKLIC